MATARPDVDYPQKEPCPWCGYTHPRMNEVSPSVWAVECPSCGALGPHNPDIFQSLELAIARWNGDTDPEQRAPRAPDRDELTGVNGDREQTRLLGSIVRICASMDLAQLQATLFACTQDRIVVKQHATEAHR